MNRPSDTALPVYVQTERGSVLVGWTDGQFYITGRDPAKHLFREHDGWGIDRDIIENLTVPYVRVVTPSGHLNYVAHVETIRRKGKRIHVPPFGPQVVLPLRFWRAETDGVAQEVLF